MHCPECGTKVPYEARFCQSCGKRVKADTSFDAGYDYSVEEVRFAGFWIRLAAYLLDAIILGIPASIVTAIFFGMDWVLEYGAADFFQAFLLFLVTIFFWTNWYGQTPGKKIVGIRIVAGENFEEIGLGKALLRYLGYLASAFLFLIGFLLIGLHGKKRGLHDLIAGTYVIYSR